MLRQTLKQLSRSLNPKSVSFTVDKTFTPPLKHSDRSGRLWSLFRSDGIRLFHSSTAVWSTDYYDLLEIPRTANEKEIKRAYHQKALKLHPDRNKSDPRAQEKFQELHKAYTTLSNPQKRRIYDQVGAENYERMESGGGGDAASGFHKGNFHADLQSVFEQFNKAFGGGGGFEFSGGFEDFFRSSGGGGFSRVMMQEVRLTFMESVQGAKKKLRLGNQLNQIEVDFPAGIDNGQQVVVDGGEHNQIIITVNVERHPVFERRGLDIYVQAHIDMVDAALGGSLRIPTLDGDSEITYRSGTQHGDKLRLGGKGIKVGRNKGDFYAIVAIVIPTRLSTRQRALLLEYSREERLKKAA